MHTHECRDCGSTIQCPSTEAECQWDGGNDGCVVCPAPVCGDDPCLHTPPHISIAQDREVNPQDYQYEPHISAEVKAARDALKDAEHTPCTDCGTLVPTIATGEGYSYLTRCPQTTSQTQTGHRVPRNEFDAAKAREAQIERLHAQ